MPELPEVEAAAQRLREAVLGHTVATVTVHHPSLRRTLSPAAQRALIGAGIERIERRGKVQLLHLSDGAVLEVHFRMTGDWDIGSVHDEAPPHERARIETGEGVRVSYTDARALGTIRRHAPGQFRAPVIGVEPLTDAFTVDALVAALARRRAAIKVTLLDQRVVAGVGNIYASEALWESRIHPETIASTLSAARAARLRDAIRLVLTTAPSGRYYGTVAHDDETVAWRVYDREGEPCPRCTRAIARLVQGGRSTYVCPRCQRR